MGKLKEISRRRFIRLSQCAALGAGAELVLGRNQPPKTEARYWQSLPDRKIKCTLCPWQCVVSEGRRGCCEVRQNQDGVYYSLVYGQIATHHIDPIEKKPLYHFLPASQAFSIATAGCNVDCKFCQNWELAQRRPEDLPGVSFSPKELVRYAKQSGSTSIAYTYNEPTIFTEYMIDVAEQSKDEGIRNVVISNGFINSEPLKDLCRVIDAYKVDLKAFTESYYRDIVGGQLRPVLETLLTLREENVWTEIVYLLVPSMNDSDDELTALSKWIYNELGPDVPIHFSRFYPKYKMRNLPPTPVKTIEKARNIALDAGLDYVYMGNVPGHEGENTLCPNCHKVIVQRVGYRIYKNQIDQGQCRHCQTKIAGIWS